MTISSATRKAGPFLGNGATSSFPFTFKVFQASDLQVIKTSAAGVDTLLVLNSDYSIALNADQNANPGGAITYPISGTKLQTGEKLTATGVLAALQGTHITNGGNFFANNIEDQMDYLTILTQQLAEQLARAVLASSSDLNPALSIGTAVQRALKYITFDASGNLSLAQTLPAGTLSQAAIGSFLYPQTAAEIATPVNFFYAPGVIDRYGTNTIPGTTNMNAAFAAALAQQQAGGAPMQLLPATYLVTTNAVKTQSNQKPVVIFGVPFKSCIVNTAPAGTPTIQLIDQFTFEISGIVFAGRATFPNTAIDLTSAVGGSRSGFGKVIDCVLLPNGIGIHLAGLNDLVIDSCKYWPNGQGDLPGAATNDGANALPGGVVSDTNGIAGYNTGEVNAVYIRDLQVGQCNATTATPPGAGILVDGSLNGSSTAPNANHASTDWHIDGYDSGACQRALYMRFCQFFTVENLYATEVRMDNNCTGMLLQSLFAGTVVVDGTKTLGGCERITYINCVATSVTADSANGIAAHINCNWFGGDADQSAPKRIIGGRVAGGNRTTDAIGGNGLCLGPAGAIQLAGTQGAGLTITTAGATVIRINPTSTCTAGILTKPITPTATLDGCTVRVINLSLATFTMAAAGTSNVADGVACVIPAQRSMDFTFDASLNLWYHS